MNFVYKNGQLDNPNEPFFDSTIVVPLINKLPEDPSLSNQVQADNIADQELFNQLVDNLPNYQHVFTYQISADRVALDGIWHRRYIMRAARGEDLGVRGRRLWPNIFKKRYFPQAS